MPGKMDRARRALTRRTRFRDQTRWPLTPWPLSRNREASTLVPLNGHPTLDGAQLLALLNNLPRLVRMQGPTIRAHFGGRARTVRFARGTLPIREMRPLLPYNQRAQELAFLLEATGSARAELVVSYLDGDGVELARAFRASGDGTPIPVPRHALHLRIGLRISGRGSVTVHRLSFGQRAGGFASFPGHSDVMVLSNGYPANDDLYRNAFLHSRVKGYQRLGRAVDVVVYRRGNPDQVRGFDGIDVVTMSDETLPMALDAHRHVLVHFMNRPMWEAIAPRLDSLRATIWIHGYEIQPWHRRAFNETTEAGREAAENASSERESLWSHVLRTQHPNLRFVFVSQTLRQQVEEDYGITLPIDRYRVIHNPIDVEHFAFLSKDPEQRFRILSIRPFASRVYANDLSVEAILALQSEPEFPHLRFRIVGDGPLFEQTVAPVRGLPNVELQQRFITSQQIAEMHREFGIFLVPSRMDSQGVSRDEAMASGLVPVTTAIAAIPEFVDEQCGVLAAPESSAELAAGILRLVRDPQLFTRMSAAAAARVRADRAAQAILLAELDVIDHH